MSSSFLVAHGLTASLICAVLGLLYAVYLIRWILLSPAGNDRMREIAAAVQQGARAYLNRQMVSIGSIAVFII
ncbi:MAG: sodium/proton-translocating pyrophosphatase, partial [Chthoniobacterales bacterium]